MAFTCRLAGAPRLPRGSQTFLSNHGKKGDLVSPKKLRLAAELFVATTFGARPCSREQPSSPCSQPLEATRQDFGSVMRRFDGHLHLIIASKRSLQACLSHTLCSQAHVHPLLGPALVDRRHITDFLDRTPEFDASEYGDCFRRRRRWRSSRSRT